MLNKTTVILLSGINTAAVNGVSAPPPTAGMPSPGSASPGGGADSAIAPTAGNPAGPGSDSFADKLYSSLIGALNVQRETQAVSPSGVAAPDPLAPAPGARPEQLADSATMADALARLQQDASARDADRDHHQAHTPAGHRPARRRARTARQQ